MKLLIIVSLYSSWLGIDIGVVRAETGPSRGRLGMSSGAPELKPQLLDAARVRAGAVKIR
jgi:hypothetical protein